MEQIPSTLERMEEVAARAARILAAGGVIIYPTDTVYGLGADATNANAVRRVQAIKRREHTKPILVMVSDREAMEAYVTMHPVARQLAARFLPGPLSLVLENRGMVAPEVLGGEATLGIRIPDHPFCLALCRAFGKPITSTSVNVSGKEQPRTIASMLAQLGDRAEDISLVVDAGELPPSAPSTVVRVFADGAVQILREGAVQAEELSFYNRAPTS